MKSLLSLYRCVLYARPASCPNALEQALRLRYQVYCLERGYEDSARYDRGMETDCFDHHAMHLVVGHRGSGQALGTARLVLDGGGDRGGAALPIEEHASPSIARHLARVRGSGNAQIAEISRLAVTRALRQRCRPVGSGHILRQQGDEATPCPLPQLASHHVSMGLLAALFLASCECAVSHWVMLLEAALLRSLKRVGIHLQPIGPVIEHRGQRQPVMARVSDVWAEVRRRGTPLVDLVQALRSEFGPVCLPGEMPNRAPVAGTPSRSVERRLDLALP